MKNDAHQMVIQGAKVHNLKNLSVSIPRDQFIVITGLSGSGKSTLAFDTLFAEGQRRYVESLSSYARQFLGRMDKPQVDAILGIPPAIAIEQKVNTRNPRSTVGTSTEIYDYLKLIFAKIGVTLSPASGKEVKTHTVDDITAYVSALPQDEKCMLLAPLVLKNTTGLIEKLGMLGQQGYARFFMQFPDSEAVTIRMEELMQNETLLHQLQQYSPNSLGEQPYLWLLIDRFTPTLEYEQLSRIADSCQTAFAEGEGRCDLWLQKNNAIIRFSAYFEEDGILFEKPSPELFSFNSPIGACPQCEGYGKIIGIDEDLVIPDQSLSVFNDAVACWKGDLLSEWKQRLIQASETLDFPIHKPYNQLTEAHKKLLWKGSAAHPGIDGFFADLEKHRYKIQNRVLLARYTGKTICPTCKGSRLKPQALFVRLGGKNIAELSACSILQLSHFFETLALDAHEISQAKRALEEIKQRLRFLLDVGLGYLSLDRLSNTLSGGESQRINLVTSLGSSLTGSLYILDEPSIGLHPRDTHRLIKVLKQLRDLGNSVLVVEHEEEIIRAADRIIDIGPGAGVWGGELVFEGAIPDRLPENNRSLTLDYLLGERSLEIRPVPKKLHRYIRIEDAFQNNLKHITVDIPLEGLVAVTGVSGSGKSTLIRGILYPALYRHINKVGAKPGQFAQLSGRLDTIRQIELVDQNPIGRSSRSNPVTYIKAYDDIRKLFAEQPHAKHNGFTASHFSFNIDGGRCEECQGDGTIRVEMQFMADVNLVCESCGGKRFKPDILEVKYHGYNVHDLLEMTIDDAVAFFGKQKEAYAKKATHKLTCLQEVGLGYLKLGQSSNTLSGGESQRVKLAAFLNKEIKEGATLFIFDEPTTGLHFHDIRKLLQSFRSLIDKGNSILVIEHNMDVVRASDWVIDLGPEGGANGGEVCFCGTPEDLALQKDSHTGQFLAAHYRSSLKNN